MRQLPSFVTSVVILVAAAMGASSCGFLSPFLNDTPQGTQQPSPPTNTSSRPSDPVVASNTPAPSARSNTNKNPAPIADKIITLAGSCSQTEEDGFREQATVSIDKNEVRGLNWQLWVGKRGSCKFDFNDFSQTKKSPNIEMVAKDGSQCRLLIWQTPDRVTLAHNGCQKRCTPGVYDDAWPVMFNPQTGSCAKLG